MLNSKKLLLLFYALIFICFKGLSQEYTLSGVVKDSSQTIAYANVILTDGNGEMVTGTITEEDGHFNLVAQQGSYDLNISFLGYQNKEQSIVLEKDTNLGTIILQPDNTQLNEVVVTATKPLIEQKVDRIVYNVDNSIASQGMSGLDALRNTPLIRVQNDNISIVGKGGVTVMINDRMLQLSNDQLTNYLQSLRSDNISKIEVITTPPSKYEAEGNSGIINIILKNNPNTGWSGIVNASFQRNSYNGFRTGATINYQSDKISSSLKLRQYNLAYQLEGTRNLLSADNSIYTSESRKDEPKAIGLNYSIDFKLNEKQNIGLIYDFNNQEYDINANGKSLYQNQSVLDSTLYTYQNQNWKTPTHTLNVYYDIKLDTLGKKISFTGNLLSNLPDKVNNFTTMNDNTSQESVVRNNSNMDYGVYSGQADVILPYQWGTLEFGAKYTLFDNNSDVGYYNLIGSEYVKDPVNSNIFDYKENNYATYISLQKDIAEKWSVKAGLRYEYTSLQGETPGTPDSRLNSSYGKIFPTAYISFKPNTTHSFSLNYSKRINRPSFQSLNPFRWYTNPYTYFTGTPTLQPSFNDNVELSYSWKGKLTAGIYNQYSQDNTANIAQLENGIYSNTIENSYDQNKIGLRLGYYETFFQIWETSFSTSGTYTVTKPTISEVEQLKVYSLSYSFNNTITLNNEKTWFLLLNFWHNLPFTYANTKMKDQLNFSPGIKTSFFDKKLKVSAVVGDVFKTLKNDGYSYVNGYRSEFYNYNDHRKLTLSASYSFGNNKVKGANKKIKFEDQYRAN